MVIIKKSGHNFAINILLDIAAAICEHEKQLDLLLLANFIDHYRAHLALSAKSATSEENEIDFYTFIYNQKLIDLATAYIAKEANEAVAPLKAL